MVRLFCVIALCLSSYTPVGAAPALSMQLQQPRTEIGRPFAVAITGHDFNQRLDTIDTTPWSEDFFVERMDLEQDREDPRTGRRPSQTLQLRLYPRATGRFTLPELHFQGTNLSGPALEVVTGRIDGQRIAVTPVMPPTDSWQKQQVIVALEVETPQRFARLRTHEIRDTGIEVLPLPMEHAVKERDGQRINLLRQAWAVFFHRPGTQEVELPAISYFHDGVHRLTFHLPKLHMRVQALPGYLPPNTPVGRVALEYALPSPWDLRSDRLRRLQIGLTGEGLYPEDLPPVLRAFQSSHSISYFPAHSQRGIDPGPQGVRGRLIHDVPYMPNGTGLLKFPALTLRYFDPQTGRLVTETIHLPWRLYVGGSWLIMLLLLIAWPVVIGSQSALKRIRAYRQRRALLRRFRAELMQAGTALALRNALRTFAAAKRWPANLTLTEWGDAWESNQRTGAAMRDCLERLSLACYGKAASVDIKPLRDELLAIFSGPMLR